MSMSMSMSMWKVFGLFLLTSALAIAGSIGGPDLPDGRRMNCNLPASMHQQNTGGSDGKGLCVYASGRHAGRWQSDPAFSGLFDYMRRYPGGSYPSKFDATLKAFCREKGVAIPEYIHVEANDYATLKLASKNRLMVGCTYSYSPTGRYNSQRIAHMISVSHADDTVVAVLDNNYIGENNYEFLTPTEFMKSATGGETMWMIILLTGSPPPEPKN